MVTMTFGKDVDDLSKPELIDEDWYLATVIAEPELAPNSKKKDGKSYDEGAGDNLIVRVKLLAEGSAGGRIFTLYFPYPSEEDKEKYDGIGMLMYDKKLAKIADFADKAEGCMAEGSEVTIRENARIGVYVSQTISNTTNEPVNVINHFSNGFMAPANLDAVEQIDDLGTDGDPLPDSIM